MTLTEGKNTDNSDSKNIYYSYFFTCSVDSFGFFFPFSTPSVIVADFIGTMKSN